MKKSFLHPAAALLLCAAMPVFSCPIPVFQYALEHWPSDPYEVIAYNFESWPVERQAAFERLAELGRQGRANVITRRENSAPAEEQAEKALMEARYPQRSGLVHSFWKGEPTEKNATMLLESPVREKIAEMLLKDKSAVWLLLESGDKAKDNAAAKKLHEELSRLEKTLTLPDPAEWGLSADALRPIAFGILRMRRDDPREEVFMRMLLETESDLPSIKGEPMVFPIYGRGLLLYALVGEGINTWTITATAEFLTGPCSCQVKAANPGLDLLMAVEWEREIKKLTRPFAQTPVGAAGFLERMKEAEKKLNEPETAKPSAAEKK